MSGLKEPTPRSVPADETLTAWVRAHTQDMLRYARGRVKDPEVAEDLVQLTFQAAWQSRDRYAGQSSPRTWLFSILKNKLADHYRKAYRDPVVHGVEGIDVERYDDTGSWLSEHRPTDWEVDEAQDAEALEQYLLECLETLPANWRAAVEMKYLKQKDAKVICQELGITATNYWQQLHRAKLKLRACITAKLAADGRNTA